MDQLEAMRLFVRMSEQGPFSVVGRQMGSPARTVATRRTGTPAPGGPWTCIVDDQPLEISARGRLQANRGTLLLQTAIDRFGSVC